MLPKIQALWSWLRKPPPMRTCVRIPRPFPCILQAFKFEEAIKKFVGFDRGNLRPYGNSDDKLYQIESHRITSVLKNMVLKNLT